MESEVLHPETTAPADAGTDIAAPAPAPASPPDVVALAAMVDTLAGRLEELARHYDHLPRDPEKLWRDAFAKRDEYKRQRDDLHQQVTDLTERLEAAQAVSARRLHRMEAAFHLRDELRRQGVANPDAALKLAGRQEEGLDDLLDPDTGALVPDAARRIIETIAAVCPELLARGGGRTPAHPDGSRLAGMPSVSLPLGDASGDAPAHLRQLDAFAKGARDDLSHWK